MDYSVSTLSTRPDCQALINIANAEKGNLEYRKTGISRQHQSASLTSLSIQTELAAVTAELATLNGIIVNLPAGTTYDETVVKIKRAEYKKFLLEQRKTNFGPIALVEKQYDIACLDHAITETDAFIASVTTRMNELPV
jgi:hypothetical protein